MINWGFQGSNNNIVTLLSLGLLTIPESVLLIHTMEVFIEFTRFLVGLLIKIMFQLISDVMFRRL